MAIWRTVWGPKVTTLKGTEASWSYVQCSLYLVSSSVNVSIFHITWPDTFRTDLVYYLQFLAWLWIRLLFFSWPPGYSSWLVLRGRVAHQAHSFKYSEAPPGSTSLVLGILTSHLTFTEWVSWRYSHGCFSFSILFLYFFFAKLLNVSWC